MSSKVSPKVSVIVPIFNVEKYIERCALSLFEQTLDEIEYIFVNDATPDLSIDRLLSVINQYQNRKDNIKIVHHKSNMGLPSARKTGIQYATGEYIYHCDSDDWCEADMLRQMYVHAISQNADICICDYWKADDNHKYPVSIGESSRLLSGPVWNKLVHRRLYENDIVYPVHNKAEDGALMMQLSYFAESIVYLHVPLYNYYYNPSSICSAITKEACKVKLFQEVANVELRENFLIDHGASLNFRSEITMMKYYAKMNLFPVISDKEIYDLWRKTYPNLASEIYSDSCISIRVKISYALVQFKLFSLYKFIKKFL